MNKTKAVLALESGDIFEGISFGYKGERLGEVVFNTSMTGYQEILSDPSYKGQIIVMTEPHIGNVGVNPDDQESRQSFCEGFVVREASPITSSWRAQESLEPYLIAKQIPAIEGIDTRRLTKILREVGAMRGILSAIDFNPKSLLKKIEDSPRMTGQDLVKDVTCKSAYDWSHGEWKLSSAAIHREDLDSKKSPAKVIVMDFGLKQNILRCLTERGCQIHVVPAKASAEEIMKLKPEGIMLSNGPGDPAAVTYAIKTLQNLIAMQEDSANPVPIFGICLGHQLLGHALGGGTFKLKFGHRGANHPVKNLKTGKIEITSQNHGFCVDIDSLASKSVELTHMNLNDNTLEGLRHKKLPLFSVQYHPESSAGPHDSRYLFDDFMKLIHKHKSKESPKEVHA